VPNRTAKGISAQEQQKRSCAKMAWLLRYPTTIFPRPFLGSQPHPERLLRLLRRPKNSSSSVSYPCPFRRQEECPSDYCNARYSRSICGSDVSPTHVANCRARQPEAFCHALSSTLIASENKEQRV